MKKSEARFIRGVATGIVCLVVCVSVSATRFATSNGSTDITFYLSLTTLFLGVVILESALITRRRAQDATVS